MKKIVIVFVVLISLCLSAQQNQNVIVLDFDDQTGKTDHELLSSAADIMKKSFERTVSCRIVAANKSCKDAKCQIEYAKNYQAVVVKTTISSSNPYMISVVFISSKNGSEKFSVKEKWDGQEKSLKSIVGGKLANSLALNANKVFSFTNANDLESCEQAMKRKTVVAWNNYLKEFPDGECVKAAQQFIEKSDYDACAKAQESKRAESLWRNYIKQFPNGKCLDKAESFLCASCENLNEASLQIYVDNFPKGQCVDKMKKLLDQELCSIAMYKNNERAKANAWRKYLEYFPNGQCAEAAKKFIENQM